MSTSALTYRPLTELSRSQFHAEMKLRANEPLLSLFPDVSLFEDADLSGLKLFYLFWDLDLYEDVPVQNWPHTLKQRYDDMFQAIEEDLDAHSDYAPGLFNDFIDICWNAYWGELDRRRCIATNHCVEEPFW